MHCIHDQFSSILSLFNGNPIQTIASSYNNKQFFQIDYKIHHGFTSDEEILIKNALAIITDRLCKADILENMYQICGTSGCLFEPGVWSRSQLVNDENYHGTYDLLRFQLMCLRLKGENAQFPTIHIYPMYEKTDTQAEGTIGCMSCVRNGSTFSIKGKFQIKLNRHNLDALNECAGNSVYWAGAIVHEMLHNLGHKHRINDYTDRWQINVFYIMVIILRDQIDQKYLSRKNNKYVMQYVF